MLSSCVHGFVRECVRVYGGVYLPSIQNISHLHRPKMIGFVSKADREKKALERLAAKRKEAERQKDDTRRAHDSFVR